MISKEDDIIDFDTVVRQAQQNDESDKAQAESGGVTPTAKIPHLPDEQGLHIKDIHRLLQEKHKTTLSEDDPVLMLVTICNAFLECGDNLIHEHTKVFRNILTDRTLAHEKTAKETIDSLAATLSQSSIVAVREVFEKQNKALQDFKVSLYWLTGIVVVIALILIIILTVNMRFT